MRVDVIGEVETLLHQKQVGGWSDFRRAYGCFCARFCRAELDDVECMNKFWRAVLSNTETGGHCVRTALNALSGSSSKRIWMDNFKKYVLICLDDINEALGEYHGRTKS